MSHFTIESQLHHLPLVISTKFMRNTGTIQDFMEEISKKIVKYTF